MSTGSDILGIVAAFSRDKNAEADRDLEREQMQARIAAVNAQDEQTNFWKQTELAKYLHSQRETLSHDYDGATKDYTKAFDDWSRANTAMQSAKLSNIPLDGFAEPLARASQALQFAQQRVQRTSTGMDNIDHLMPQIIANFRPPRQTGQQGQEGQPSMPSMPPSMGGYEQPSMAMPGDQAAPPTPTTPAQAMAGGIQAPGFTSGPNLVGMGGKTPPGSEQAVAPEQAQAQAQQAPQAAPAAPLTPEQMVPEHLQPLAGLLKRYHFPAPQAGADGNSLSYIVDTKAQAQNLQQTLDTIAKTQNGIPPPATVTSRQELAQDALTKQGVLEARSSSLGNRIAFYKSMKKSSDMVAMIRAISNDPNSEIGNQEGGNFATIIDANEKDRIALIDGIISDLQAKQRPLDAKSQELEGAFNVYMKSTLGPILGESAGGSTQTAAPVPKGMSDQEFKNYYIGIKQWDPAKPQDWQKVELQDALKKYRAGQ